MGPYTLHSTGGVGTPPPRMSPYYSTVCWQAGVRMQQFFYNKFSIHLLDWCKDCSVNINDHCSVKINDHCSEKINHDCNLSRSIFFSDLYKSLQAWLWPNRHATGTIVRQRIAMLPLGDDRAKSEVVEMEWKKNSEFRHRDQLFGVTNLFFVTLSGPLVSVGFPGIERPWGFTLSCLSLILDTMYSKFLSLSPCCVRMFRGSPSLPLSPSEGRDCLCGEKPDWLWLVDI